MKISPNERRVLVEGGEDSILNQRAGDFVLAMNGLLKAHDRFRNRTNDAYITIECSWWIAAATEACGRRNDESIVDAFYWVRNKGFHEIAVALGQIQPGKPGQPLGVEPLGVEPIGGGGVPARWKQLWGPSNGSRQTYNERLAGRPVAETIGEAVESLLHTLKGVQEASGLPVFDELNRTPTD